MTQNCASCGQPYEAKRQTSRFCSTQCRVRASRGHVVEVGSTRPTQGHVVAATRAELDAADREASAFGQAALALAERIDARQDTGAGLASLTREWRMTLVEAVKGAGAQASPLDKARDELARRRAARGA